jgi:hypothetical protein
MAAPDNPAPWVIVAGGFHPLGGMDRANLALARHLIGAGTPVHLVAHEIDSAIAGHPLVTAHRVVRPRGMPALADHLLGRAGMKTARDVLRTRDDARVVVNGGNCPWPDINWVHALHAAWPVCDAGAPWWSRYRHRRLKEIARRRERQALGQARIVIANSEATRHALHEHLGIHGDRVRTVYLGSDPSWGPADPAERERARSSFDIPAGAPVAAFVGTLGADVGGMETAPRVSPVGCAPAGRGWRLAIAAVAEGRRTSRRIIGAFSRVHAGDSRGAGGLGSIGQPGTLRGLWSERARGAVPGNGGDGHADCRRG